MNKVVWNRTVALDLDGVCYDWDGIARFLLQDVYGTPPIPRPSQDWHHIENHVPKAAWKWLWSEGIRTHGLFRHGNMIRGSLLGAQRLVSAGFRLSVLTKRPREYPNVAKDTIDWLLYHKYPVYNVRILGNEDKANYPHGVYIDDNPDNLKSVPETSSKVLFSRPWNARTPVPPGVLRVHDWKDITDHLVGPR